MITAPNISVSASTPPPIEFKALLTNEDFLAGLDCGKDAFNEDAYSEDFAQWTEGDIIKFADGELSQRIFERSNQICRAMDLVHGVPYERFSYLYNIGFVLSYVEQVVMAQLEAFND